MKITSTYSVKLNNKDVSHVLKDTVSVFRDAVAFYIKVINNEWDSVFAAVSFSHAAQQAAEKLSVTSKAHPVVKYDFGKDFYKFPSYCWSRDNPAILGRVISANYQPD